MLTLLSGERVFTVEFVDPRDTEMDFDGFALLLVANKGDDSGVLCVPEERDRPVFHFGPQLTTQLSDIAIDTGSLPKGIYRFVVGSFSERVARAVASGASQHKLLAAELPEWGCVDQVKS